MITIPPYSRQFSNTSDKFYLNKSFEDLIKFFNELESNLQYPNCEGIADSKRILLAAQTELIKWGKI